RRSADGQTEFVRAEAEVPVQVVQDRVQPADPGAAVARGVLERLFELSDEIGGRVTVVVEAGVEQPVWRGGLLERRTRPRIDRSEVRVRLRTDAHVKV